MTWDNRLTPQVFALEREGKGREFTFYALTESAGLKLAKTWASAHGWRLAEAEPPAARAASRRR